MLKQKTFFWNGNGKTKLPTPTKELKWFYFDISGKVLGRAASMIAQLLKGKHLASYTPHALAPVGMVVTGVDQVVLTRKKWDQKKYYRHTGYPGGLKEQTAVELKKKDPTAILRFAVAGMLGHTKLAKGQMKRLKIYANSEHPHQAQKLESIPDWFLKRNGF